MQKQLAAMFVVLATALTLAACADYYGKRHAAVMSVQAILDNPVDDMDVIVSGNITHKVADEKYRFSDGTGQINIEIDDDELPRGGLPSPETQVEIYGEVDYDKGKAPEIDAKSVRVVQVPEGGM